MISLQVTKLCSVVVNINEEFLCRHCLLLNLSKQIDKIDKEVQVNFKMESENEKFAKNKDSQVDSQDMLNISCDDNHFLDSEIVSVFIKNEVQSDESENNLKDHVKKRIPKRKPIRKKLYFEKKYNRNVTSSSSVLNNEDRESSPNCDIPGHYDDIEEQQLELNFRKGNLYFNFKIKVNQGFFLA